MNTSFYSKMKENVDSIYDVDEMESCIDINEEIDSSEEMNMIADSLVSDEALSMIPRNEYGEIDFRGILSISNSVTEENYLIDLKTIESEANRILDENDSKIVEDALKGLYVEHYFKEDKMEANVDEYISQIKESFDDILDDDSKIALEAYLDNIKEETMAEPMYQDDYDAFRYMNKEAEEKRLEMEAEERQKAIDEKNERDFEKSLERSNKFHEALNEFEGKISDDVKDAFNNLVFGKNNNKDNNKENDDFGFDM